VALLSCRMNAVALSPQAITNQLTINQKCMKKKLFVQCVMMLTLLLASMIVRGQTKVLNGKVVDETAAPLSGATIKVKGATAATVTDSNGAFSLSIPVNAQTLEVSFVGYEVKLVPITGNDLKISLNPSTNQGLNEVVVIGYGTARKKDLTGSLVTVNEASFNKGIMTSPDQLIQGKTPGVMVINNTGQPGGAATVRIRGNSSIRASNNPLFVLDGVPMSGNSPLPEGRGGFASDRGNPLTYLNPGDISSMDILKDASATAIYGSRGANGVVIITTKRGKPGPSVLSVGASAGVSNMREFPDVLNAARFREALQYYTPGEVANADFGQSVDAFKAITRDAATQNYYADVSGGTEDAKFRLSGGYLNQNGIIRTSQLKKYTANFTGNFRFLKIKDLG
jgi:TonB-dependent SusC/RagA subfamily outer membrane receptor